MILFLITCLNFAAVVWIVILFFRLPLIPPFLVVLLPFLVALLVFANATAFSRFKPTKMSGNENTVSAVVSFKSYVAEIVSDRSSSKEQHVIIAEGGGLEFKINNADVFRSYGVGDKIQITYAQWKYCATEVDCYVVCC